MKDIIRKTIVKGFSLLPAHLEFINHFIEEKGTYTSESDVVRKALEFFHDKTFPDYVYKLTPAAEQKKKKLDQEKEFISQTDDEVANSINGVQIIPDTEGKKYVVIHSMGNNTKAVPLEGFKQWASTDLGKDYLNDHYEGHKKLPLTIELLRTRHQHLVQKHNLVYPDTEPVVE